MISAITRYFSVRGPIRAFDPKGRGAGFRQIQPFVLALLTKSVTATLPAALLVVLWWQRGRVDWRRDVLPLLPWFAVGITSGLFTAWVEHTIIGASGKSFDLTLAQHILLAERVPFFIRARFCGRSI